jgi:hypothetical protein
VDADHKRVMSEAVTERVPARVLVDLRPQRRHPECESNGALISLRDSDPYGTTA